MYPKLAHLAAVAAVAVLATAVTADAAPSAARAGCAPAAVVLYTTDSARLATELGKTPSSCADYYVSVSPTATGAPRGGAPVTTIHGLGAHVHALAEVRLALWAPYAAANGWFNAGVEVRREMRAAGYDASAGDSWAVNEVGAPSGTQMGVDVLNGAGTSRQDLRDFLRGLYTGDDGIASGGVVFAADPLHVASDVSGYKQALRRWYTDTAFWTDMHRYVRYWAQETYADSRAWGVAGASLADRSAYLTDYLMHGSRAAAGGDDRTAAARAFLAAAYMPLGNASFRWPAPDATTGIGFGHTDVDLQTMLGFVSAQTYAMRTASPVRLGFAVVPRSATASESIAVEDRVATAVQSSESSATGACSAGCDGDVADAHFNPAWQTFANTREGTRVAVRLAAVKVTFAAVTGRGATSATRVAVHPPRALGYAVDTTATHTGTIEVCLPRPAGHAPRISRLTGSRWVDVTTVVGKTFVCGRSPVLGTFAV